MLFPLYIKDADTCRKCGNLNYDQVVFKVNFDVYLMKTLKVNSIKEVLFYFSVFRKIVEKFDVFEKRHTKWFVSF